eukprot:Phypoly_transcript_08904.p1 GENE.Phypoly_transcript_08904~~Phypoly_transcript_08904.p1  ORF type:complete len:438 (+),score=66.02 Phypoly_transcript_08904:126-1439(+)
MNLSSVFVALFLLLEIATCSKLVYLEKPTDETGIEFLGKIAGVHDVRGDYGNFMLIVDHGNFFSENIIFSSFNDALSYYVAEPVDLSFSANSEIPSSFMIYDHAFVLGKCVFAIPKEKESEFVGAFPIDYEFVLVPDTPLPAPSLTTFSPTAPDPRISSLISTVNSNDLRGFVTYLSGEASSLITRQAQSQGAISAQNWLQQQFTQFGFSVTTQAFRTGFSSNVVATLPGAVNSKKLVLVTAHYDDRGPILSSTTERAPGANDNGSGTGALLQIAKLLHNNKVSLGYTVVLIAFSGEEQGLYGSAYAAQQYKAAGADIVAVLNADMIAYRHNNEAPQVAFVSRSSTPSLNTLLSNITKTYVTGLTVGTTTACCTDHASFYNQGFPATSYFERNGPIADPQYHKSGDLVNRPGYDLDLQYPLIVKSMFAGLLTVAQLQ